MNEEALRQLSQEQLIVLVLQQQEMLHALQKQNEGWMLRVQGLEAKVAALNQPAKTAANSSVPPSASRKANRTAPRGTKRKGRDVG